MTLDFLRQHGAQRLASYAPQPPLLDPPDPDDEQDEDAGPEGVDLDVEIPAGLWSPQPVAGPPDWRPRDWPERPIRFVDGKDVGETVAWLRAPGGHPVPIRLSQIGGVAVRVEDGECRREFGSVERVVSMVVDPFPWDEIEAFAAALQEHGFRLLPAAPPGGVPSYDFEVMRKAAQNRSNTEMGVLEEAALAQDNLTPTIVDGRLEPRAGGLDQARSPVAGVIKKQMQNYLHARGLQLLYQLESGERTPLFALPRARLPVVSWYLRLAGTAGAMPNWGLVRVELPLRWFERLGDAHGLEHIARLSRTLCAYRCRESSYGRAPVSLHPIVRAEQSLGAMFTAFGAVEGRFTRLAGI